MNIYDYKTQFEQLNIKFNLAKHSYNGLQDKLLQLKNLQNTDGFWQNQELCTKTNKSIKIISNKLKLLEQATNQLQDVSAMLAMLLEDENCFSENELVDELNKLEEIVQCLFTQTLLNKPYDECSAIISFHPGAGGEEAQDWAEMLSRMYKRYAEKNEYGVVVLDYLVGDGAGIKSETILIEGDYAYGNLRTESGVHRLVRLSPFDANNRRHTSFASVEVSPYITQTDEIILNPSDLKIDTFKSSGAGGQHVNKTESAIRLTHLPTGIVVQCQNERSQIKNKEMALKMLTSKLMQLQIAKKEEEKKQKQQSNKKIEWGSQIRSYVLHPYNLVKDHRTNAQTSNTLAVLDGDIQDFINQFLKVDV